MFYISVEKLFCFCSLNICSSTANTSEASLSSNKKGEFNANPYFHLSPNTAASSTEMVWFFLNEFGIPERAQIDRLDSDGQISAQN